MPYKPAIDVEQMFSRWMPWAVAIFGLLLFTALSFLEPADPPTNQAAHGCYVSRSGPPILIDKAGIKITGSDFARVPFRLQWDDQGILLWPQQRLILADQIQPPRFQLENEPGLAFVFVDLVGSRVYPDVDASDLSMFQVSTASWNRVAYSRTGLSECSGQ